MTSDSHPDISISSEHEFETVLAAALEAAALGGIDVRGAWEFQTGGSSPDWEINISELARGTDGE